MEPPELCTNTDSVFLTLPSEEIRPSPQTRTAAAAKLANLFAFSHLQIKDALLEPIILNHGPKQCSLPYWEMLTSSSRHACLSTAGHGRCNSDSNLTAHISSIKSSVFIHTESWLISDRDWFGLQDEANQSLEHLNSTWTVEVEPSRCKIPVLSIRFYPSIHLFLSVLLLHSGSLESFPGVLG